METRLEIARAAQKQWGAQPVRDRAKLLRRLRAVMSARIDDLVATVSREVSKPAMDALAGDVLPTLEHLRYYEQHAEGLLWRRRVGQPGMLFRGARFEEIQEPYGVVLVLAPWNYPLQLAMVPAVTALYAGNAVVLKCSERTPQTAALIAALAREAGLPEGVLQVSAEAPRQVRALIEAGPDLIFFTGSSGNGRAVAAMASEKLIPTILELGGKDACLVFDSCNRERTVEGVCYAAFANAGQVCVGAKRLLVQQTIFDEFVKALTVRAGALRIGTGLEHDRGPVAFEFVETMLRRQVADAVARGATLHTPWHSTGRDVPALILTGVPADAALMVEESFGPVLCVEAFADEEDAVRRAKASAFQLSASVFTGDAQQAERVAMQLPCGSCTVNDAIRHVGNPYAAFGGNGASGHGRYHGAQGLRAFSRTKTVMTVKRMSRREVHWFPFDAKTYSGLRAILMFRHADGSMWSRLRSLIRNVKNTSVELEQKQK